MARVYKDGEFVILQPYLYYSRRKEELFKIITKEKIRGRWNYTVESVFNLPSFSDGKVNRKIIKTNVLYSDIIESRNIEDMIYEED